jgi:hypothetical protein
MLAVNRLSVVVFHLQHNASPQREKDLLPLWAISNLHRIASKHHKASTETEAQVSITSHLGEKQHLFVIPL